MNKVINMHSKFCEELIDKLINRIVHNNFRSETLVSMNASDISLSTPALNFSGKELSQTFDNICSTAEASLYQIIAQRGIYTSAKDSLYIREQNIKRKYASMGK